METELDVENVEKILEAAQQIARMAKTRPDQAAEMMERARYLVELAEQIKRDWLIRFATLPPVADALAHAAPPRADSDRAVEMPILQGAF
jgi:hypothetical protein